MDGSCGEESKEIADFSPEKEGQLTWSSCEGTGSMLGAFVMEIKHLGTKPMLRRDLREIV